MGSVAVIGVGHSAIRPEVSGVSLQELVYEGSTAVLADAGITRDDIDSVVLSASDLVDGRGIASMLSAAAAGGYMKHETRTTNDGIYALIMAAMEILAGRTKIAIVMSWNKMSEVKWRGAARATVEPFYQQPVGVDDISAQALAAASALCAQPQERALATQALLRNRQNARDNPRAAVRSAISAGDVERSPVVDWPLREADLPADADGALGMIVVDGDIARAWKRPCVYVRGFAWGTDAVIEGRDLARGATLCATATSAYRRANLRSLDDVDLIELSARSSFEEVAILDELVRPFGADARALVKSGATERSGTLPVNPSGGCSGTYLMQAAGLCAASEIVLQLTGRAGPVQIPGAKVGVAHGQSGHAMQSNAVVVLATSEGDA